MADKKQMPPVLVLMGVAVIAYLWFYILPRIRLSALDYVLWVAVSAALIGWHWTTSRKAQAPASRAALFERHKAKYVFDEINGQWYRKHWKKNIHGLDFFDRNRGTRADRLINEDAAFKKEFIWSCVAYFMLYPMWILYKYLHMSEIYADLYSRIGMQPPKPKDTDAIVIWPIIGLVSFWVALTIVRHIFYINGFDRMYDVEIKSALVLDPPAVLPDLDGHHGPPVGEMPDTGEAVPLDEYQPKR